MVYLDNNATTRPSPEVVEAVAATMRDRWANPSSVHRFGQLARQQVEVARQQVAGLIGCAARDLVFTSGGTEANNLAIRGLLGAAGRPVLITTRVEHSAVREPAEALAAAGGELVWVPTDGDGVVDVAALIGAIAKHVVDGAVGLVSIQWANNETGLIQPMATVAAAVAEARRELAKVPGRGRLWLHSDATQAVGKIPVDAAATGLDLMTLSAHKLHGPKGVGALFRRSGVRLAAQQLGGPQERELRGGTENTAGIVGFGVAAEQAQAHLADEPAVARLRALRDRFEQSVCQQLPGTVVNSAGAPRLPNTSSLGFAGLEAEAILVGLSERGVCASAGAACSSGSLEPSPVLMAMGIPEAVAHGSVRFSLSRQSTDQQIDQALGVLPTVVARLRRTMPV